MGPGIIKSVFHCSPVVQVFLLLMAFIPISGVSVSAQRSHTFQGVVTDESGEPLTGATLRLVPGEQMVVSNGDGRFLFVGLETGSYVLYIYFTGFTPYTDTIAVPVVSSPYRVTMRRGVETLHEVIVYGNHPLEVKRTIPLDVEVITADYLRQQMGGSLMQSLNRLPGVESMDIGSGHSKPAIRGLGFNRVMVAEHGIRHQGQQWGSDHGLEIDQFAAEHIEIIKGPASLMYGPDAIGGVILIRHRPVPLKGTSGGTLDLHAAGNNGLIGSSVMLYSRLDRFHFSLRASGVTYGDYRVPGEHVDIYSYRVPLNNNRLRNTAGRERGFHLSGGYDNGRFRNRTFISHLHSRGGFFAHAHGLEPRNVDTVLHDMSFRDILNPYHEVTHSKVVNHSIFSGSRSTLIIKTGYQHNNRQEHGDYSQHGFMPPLFPDSIPFPVTLERAFRLDHLTAVVRVTRSYGDGLHLTAGTSVEWQQNRISGRNFIIPEYTQHQTGVFVYGRQHLSEQRILHLGIRYDYSFLSTRLYRDWFATPVLTDQDTVYENLVRSPAVSHRFNTLTWSAGYNHNINNLVLKVNFGKGFRMPLAQELAANGVNYHQFSYQVGNPALKPEVSWQLDLGAAWHHTRFAVSLTPFANLFTNYIYLNPTPDFDRVYGNGQQVYRFSESEVLRFGGELHAHFQILSWLKSGIMMEYVWSEQLSGEKRGFTLPFTPPLASIWHLKASRPAWGRLHKPWVGIDLHWVAAQNRIVPPEEPTPGYKLLNFSAGSTVSVAGTAATFTIAVRNLLNTRYYRHNSYYRLINLPEPGRNVTFNMTLPFNRLRKNEK